MSDSNKPTPLHATASWGGLFLNQHQPTPSYDCEPGWDLFQTIGKPRRLAIAVPAGPNDARCIVWAIGILFYFISHFLYTKQCFCFFLGSIYVLKITGRARMAAMMKTGP